MLTPVAADAGVCCAASAADALACGDYDPDHLASLYQRCSLHPIDRFFMLIRRRLSLLERPTILSSRTGRIWSGYSAYQPANIERCWTSFASFATIA